MNVFAPNMRDFRTLHWSFAKIPSGLKPVAINNIPKPANEASAWDDPNVTMLHPKKRRTKFLRTTVVAFTGITRCATKVTTTTPPKDTSNRNDR
jgi:hypothetical protein